jgi:hypothetical protein
MSDTMLQAAVRRIIECYWHPAGIGPAQRFDEQTTKLAWADLRMSLGVEQLHTPMPNPDYWLGVVNAPNEYVCRLAAGMRVRVKTTGELATFDKVCDGLLTPQGINEVPCEITLDTGPYMGTTVREPLCNLERMP